MLLLSNQSDEAKFSEQMLKYLVGHFWTDNEFENVFNDSQTNEDDLYYVILSIQESVVVAPLYKPHLALGIVISVDGEQASKNINEVENAESYR